VILDIDAGNSFVKWRVKDGDALIGSGSEPTEQVMAAGLELSKIDSLSQARVASVAHQRLVETLRQQLQRQFKVELRIARVSPSVAGVSCGYSEPETLGIDRWLAAVAAYQKYLGAVLVVDAGSAITIDLVGPQGQHLGGYICPGLRLMRQALWQGTDRVQVDEIEPLNMLVPGTSTQDAVNRGCLLAAVATIEKLASQYPASIVITGGDAATVASALSLPADQAPSLVLDGLAVTGVEYSETLIS
jgi:type III pantothenate kinase